MEIGRLISVCPRCKQEEVGDTESAQGWGRRAGAGESGKGVGCRWLVFVFVEDGSDGDSEGFDAVFE